MTPDRAAPDDTVSFSGTGLAANHPYFIAIGIPNGSLPLLETSDGQGSFRGAYKIPSANVTPDTYRFCLYPSEAGWPPQTAPLACTTLTVVGPTSLPPTARLSLTPTQVRPGAYVSVSGSGFPPGRDFWVSIPNGLPAASMPIPETADSQGKFGPVSTPAGDAPPGTYRFCVQGSTICATLTLTS